MTHLIMYVLLLTVIYTSNPICRQPCTYSTSLVQYSNTLLSGCPQSLILRLQNVQYNAARSILLMIPKHEDISLHLAYPHWLSIDACIMYKQTCIYFLQLISPRVSPSSGLAGMVMSIIFPLCSVQYVLLLNTKLSISIVHVCMHVVTCARAHTRTRALPHARTYTSTHVRTYECTHIRGYARKNIRTFVRTHVCTPVCTHVRTHARTHVCTCQPVCILFCE